MDHQTLISHLKRLRIHHPKLLHALRHVRREVFVPDKYFDKAYENTPIPIGYGQTMSQPYIIAKMIQTVMQNNKFTKVLEIGTGSGFQTALLASIYQDVYTIERLYSLHIQAKNILSQYSFNNIHFYYEDGSMGLAHEAPFDAIVISARLTEIPYELLSQLDPHFGCLIAPIGGIFSQCLELIIRKDDHFEKNIIEKVRFVPLKKGKN